MVNTRDGRILRFRIEGLSYTEIARVVGVSRATALRAVLRELERLRARINRDAEELKRLEVARLERLLRELRG